MLLNSTLHYYKLKLAEDLFDIGKGLQISLHHLNLNYILLGDYHNCTASRNRLLGEVCGNSEKMYLSSNKNTAKRRFI